MDTWATSSLTPQIAGQWLECPELYARVYPFWLRPQSHEIIRTWAFYTLAMSHHHFGRVPWSDVMISGWGLAPAGEGKISKSRGGGPVAPGELIRRYSADAVRYWAAGTGPGKDALISEERVQQGAKLVTKLWNVARLAEPFVAGREAVSTDQPLSPADRWVLSRLQHVIVDATAQWQDYDYAAARSLVEAFFWRELADNYLEMAKLRLYDSEHPLHQAACRTLRHVLLDVTRMLAPLVPYVTEAVYLALYAAAERWPSVHRAPWPEADAALDDAAAEALGERLVAIATAVRRYKSEAGLSLAVRFPLLWLAAPDDGLRGALDAARADLLSVTRADGLEVRTAPPPQGLRRLATEGPVDVWLDLGPREP
jgi:valyl-tRNA synthetase